jgi:hypothetical protein
VGHMIVFVDNGCQHPEKHQDSILKQKCKDCKLYDGR